MLQVVVLVLMVEVDLTCGVVTLKVVPAVGVAGRGEMLFWAWAWAWAWARACWGTMTSWPISVRTNTIPAQWRRHRTHRTTTLSGEHHRTTLFIPH